MNYPAQIAECRTVIPESPKELSGIQVFILSWWEREFYDFLRRRQ